MPSGSATSVVPARRPDIARFVNGPPAGGTASRRRQAVVAGTLVAGTTSLAATLAAPPGSWQFYGLGLLSAVCWLAGGLRSGPIPARRSRGGPAPRREVAAAVAVGAVSFAVFCGAALLADRVPALSDAVQRVLSRAETGSLWLVLGVALINGVGEEIFFRGALPAAIAVNHRALWSTAVYGLVTIATLNPALVAAALVMGTVFSIEREATGGVAAPIVTHVTWSTLMLLFLPR